LRKNLEEVDEELKKPEQKPDEAIAKLKEEKAELEKTLSKLKREVANTSAEIGYPILTSGSAGQGYGGSVPVLDSGTPQVPSAGFALPSDVWVNLDSATLGLRSSDVIVQTTKADSKKSSDKESSEKEE